MELPPFLRLRPRYLPKVWGGRRLQPSSLEPIGEAWIVAGDSYVAGGALDGTTLDELARDAPLALLGRSGDDGDFPLLIKLLEATQWLSVQVHPDDALARELEGPGSRGKTEAWYVIDAAPGAELIVGLRDGARVGELESVASDSRILELLAHVPVRAGDVFFMPAGTIHAIGPGVLIFEVQQMSDITYRLFDWERPASAGRELHVAQSMHVLRNIDLMQSNRAKGNVERVVCDYFMLEELTLSGQSLARDTAGLTFHAVTALSDGVRVTVDSGSARLGAHDTVLIPSVTGSYTLSAEHAARALIVSLPVK